MSRSGSAPLVSVIVCTYNRCESLRDTLEALNRGMREARGDLVAFTDDDVMPTPSWVQRLVCALEEHQADVMGGHILPLWLQPPPAWLAHDEVLLGLLAILDRGPAPIVAALQDAYFIQANTQPHQRELGAQ